MAGRGRVHQESFHDFRSLEWHFGGEDRWHFGGENIRSWKYLSDTYHGTWVRTVRILNSNVVNLKIPKKIPNYTTKRQILTERSSVVPWSRGHDMRL
jgi:hypothetical protein